MLTFALVLLVALNTSPIAHAVEVLPSKALFECKDIPSLEEALKKLRAECSSPVATEPRAVAPKSTPNRPKQTSPKAETAAGEPRCETKGHSASTAEEAIAQCSAEGTAFNEQECGRELKCSGGAGFWRARGYVGESQARAIELCSREETQYDAADCRADLKCVGPKEFCKK